MQRSLALLALTTLTTALPSQIRRSTTAGVSHGITSDPAALGNRTFDYVICGGGLTGLTVASRLSEDPNINVLVIEAGYDNHTSPLVSTLTTCTSFSILQCIANSSCELVGQRCPHVWPSVLHRLGLRALLDPHILAERLSASLGRREDARRERQLERS